MFKKLCLLLFMLCQPIFFGTRISATEVKDLDLSISLSEAQRQKISFEAPDDSKRKQYSIFLMDSSRSMGGRSIKQTKDMVGKFVKESGASKQEHQIIEAAEQKGQEKLDETEQKLTELNGQIADTKNAAKELIGRLGELMKLGI